MSYEALARKYRPSTFTDLIGQEAVVLALRGGIELQRYPSGLIFSGIRGVGKTTIARLYAKALNCDKGPSIDPCEQCASCIAVSVGNHEDVLEIDGASNNGVDEVRSLKETVSYLPQRSKFKIYIIDEVHMLSTSAFNALLKTLEEPPKDVVFIFATTEIQKVPATVIGRCQAYYLKKIPQHKIIHRLDTILNKEGIVCDKKALALIAKQGHGSLRDALTFLDQVIALSGGKQIDVSILEQIVGSLSLEPYLQLLSALIEKDASRCVEIIAKLDHLGIEFSDATRELTRLLRHGFILKEVAQDSFKEQVLDLDDQDLAYLIKIAQKSKDFDLNRIFRSFIQCLKELDGSFLDRFVFENYCLEWCLDPGLLDIDEFIDDKKFFGIENYSKSALEKQIPHSSNHDMKEELKTNKKISFSNIIKSEQVKEIKASESDTKEDEPKVKDVKSNQNIAVSKIETGFPSTWKDLVERWKGMRPLQARKLEEVYPIKYNEQEIILAVEKEGIIGPVLLQEETQKRLQQTLKDLFFFNGKLKIVLKNDIDKISSDVKTKSLLEEKEKNMQDLFIKKKSELENHLLTKELLKQFSGETTKIEIN